MERHRPHIVTSFTRPRLSLSHLCTFSSRLDHALTPAGPLARLPTTGQQASSRRRHIRLTRVPRCTYLLTGRPMLASLLARSSWHFDMGIGSAVPMYVFGPDMSALVCESQLASRADHTDHVIVVVLYRVDMPIRSWELPCTYILHLAEGRGSFQLVRNRVKLGICHRYEAEMRPNRFALPRGGILNPFLILGFFRTLHRDIGEAANSFAYNQSRILACQIGQSKARHTE